MPPNRDKIIRKRGVHRLQHLRLQAGLLHHSRHKIRHLMRIPRLLLWAFVLEGKETRDMMRTFIRQGQGKILLKKEGAQPTEEEIAQAYEQLRDIPKFLPFFVLVVVPLPGVTEGYALLAITLEGWLGKKVSLLPSRIREVFKK